MIKQSFTLRVLVVSFLVLALPLLVDSFVFFHNSYSDGIKEAKLELREAANFCTFTLSGLQPVKSVLLSEINYLLDLGGREDALGSEKLNQELAALASVGGNFQILILDLGKEHRYKTLASSVPGEIGSTFISYLKLAHVIDAGEGVFVRRIYSHSEKRFIPHIFITELIRSKDTGKPFGIIVITANIEKQLNIALSQKRQNKNVKFAILNADGVVFAAVDQELVGKYFDSISPKRRKEIMTAHQMGEIRLPPSEVLVIPGDDPPFFEFIFDDQVQIAYRAFMATDFGISVVAYSSKEAFFGAAIRQFLFIYSVYGLILVIGGGITYWLSLWISRPLRQLSSVMGEVSEGNLAVRFKKEPLGFEINILGEIFNNTLVTLLENIQRAEDERVKKEAYQRELAIGRQVQHSLLPAKIPKISGAEVAGIYLPALEVGGDFYSYISRTGKGGEETLTIVVADAAGKGISPCLYSLSARSLLRTFATIVDDPGEALSHTNNAFLADADDSGMFVTMFTGVYRAESRMLSYYSCGHVPPIVRRADGHLITLENTGMALGLQESKGYRSDSIQLESGDLVIFYTNGLTEAINDTYQPFSERRLRNCLQQRKWTTAQEAVDGLTTELQAFTGKASQEEEVVIVALKID